MDLTQKYILMSKQSQELQQNWIPDYGDYYRICCECDNNNLGYYIISETEELEELQQDKKEGNLFYNWIPKQDQLQLIYANWSLNGNLIKASNWFIVALDDFQDWVLNYNKELINPEDDYILQFTSLEQLWLAFVMLMVYDKVWNNDINKWEMI